MSGSARGTPGFEGMQIETSDITGYERFFDIIRATLVHQLDHPHRDKLREYCYRGVVIAVRQDLAVARPTGWVQLNFAVSDVAVIRRDLEQALESSTLASIAEIERARIIRFRLKPDVIRGGCRVIRFEVSGPEGFMIGFDQFHAVGCRTGSSSTSDDLGAISKP